MPDAITTAFVQEYKANVDLILQQLDNRISGNFSMDTYTGKAGSAVEQFGPVDPVKSVSRHEDTPLLDVPQQRRWVFPEDWKWGSMVDRKDTLRMIVDATGPYVMNMAAAMNRAKDLVGINAFFATAKVGENGTDNETFDTSSYQVGHDVGGTASSLNVAKLKAAKKIVMKAYKGEIPEMVFMGISTDEHDSLLNDIQVINRDYNGGQPTLVEGMVRRYMGFEFIVTELLNDDGTDRLIPAWTRSGMHLGLWQDFEPDISRRPDKSNGIQVYGDMTLGATRTQPGKVVQVLCDLP